jgi:glycerol-3-phosphate dehydrogenase
VACDLLIIGGGINGLGIAADAAARGLSVLLVEKGDFGGGTTSASSRLIHGGLRYLRHGEIGLVRESLRERGILLRQRPHLVGRLEMLIPGYRGVPPPAAVVSVGLGLYDLLARDPVFGPSRRLTVGEVREREPGLAAQDLVAGHAYQDGQISFPERLCVELMRATVAAGGEARNHTRVVGLRLQARRVTGAQLRDQLTGAEEQVEADHVINAAGPWVDAVNALLPSPPTRLLGGTSGTHIVLPARPGGPRGAIYTAARSDGRPFFILPWDGRVLVGTTDVPYQGDPDQLRIQEWEVEYLLRETNRLFPACDFTSADVQLSTIGVRPLPASGASPGAVTRRHFLVDHRRRDGIEGLASVIGGKLTTYRSLAEQVVDWVLRSLGRPHVPCPTRGESGSTGVWRVPATAGDGSVGVWEGQAAAALRETGIPEAAALRLVALYGSRWGEVLEYARHRPEGAVPLAPGSRALAAEVPHAVDREAARTAEDVLLRRLMLLPPTDQERAAVDALLRREAIGHV